ncbi:MAG: PEP/pyruvate-binding domain-containing protein [Actinomycetales bacterium]
MSSTPAHALILPLASLDRSMIPVAGGKGANLGELVNAGLPVPDGFVITTAGYDAFVAEHGLHDRIVALATQATSESTMSTNATSTASAGSIDPEATEAACGEIQRLFAENLVPGGLATQIADAYTALGQGEAPVAVRSSATAEDLPEASFAGQQDTFLNVRGAAAVVSAVRECWASLWTARAVAYRHRQGIPPAQVSLAVVVQVLIDADASGIAFTANPVTGARDEVVISASWGLGEAVVGGQVTPDSVIVQAGGLTSRQTADKSVMTVRTATGGTTLEPVAETMRSKPVLTDETACRLADLGIRISEHFQTPMDVEWAISQGRISILQARPITSLPPAPLREVTWEPPVPNTIWMRRQIVEHMPEPLSPLFEDLYLDQGLRKAMAYLSTQMSVGGGTPFDYDDMLPAGFTATINGFAYTTASFRASTENLLAILKIYAHLPRLFRLPAFDWEGTVLPRYQGLVARWATPDPADLDSADLLRAIDELAAEDARYWLGSALNLGMSRMMDGLFNGLLKFPLVRRALPQPPPGSSSFLRGFASKALDAQSALETMADQVRASAALRDLVIQTPAPDLPTALADLPEAAELVAALQQYTADYGHQIYNLDFVAPTQGEDPLAVLLSLQGLVRTPPPQGVRTRQAEMAAQRDHLVATTERNLDPVTRRLFAWFWRWTRHYAPYREHVMFHMGSGWPTARCLAAELGGRLTQWGALHEAEEIFYLRAEEITDIIEAQEAGQPVPDRSGLARDRRDLRQARMRLTPQPVVPERGQLRFGPFTLRAFNPTPDHAPVEDGALTGYPVSAGTVTATACVIRSSEDFATMQPGSILVAPTTTPAWTPLFSQAVGLVTDVGGALAHGSIVAREYGIPAVMGTGVATERIRSGMLLTVDGDRGTVRIDAPEVTGG